MAELNQEVADRVRQELTDNPELGSRQLFDTAQEMDPSLSSLSVQQFHGRYVLPVRRDQAAQREQSGEVRPRKQSRKSRGTKRAAKRGTGEATSGDDAQQETAAAESAPAKGARKGAAKSPRKGAAKKARGGKGQEAAQQETAAAPESSSSESSQSSGSSEPSIGREQVRAVFLQFARDFAEAESRTEIVQVLSKLDEYVDRVVPGGR